MAEFLFLFQFQKNKYDLQATKKKLVEAANYVDKVRPDICFAGKPVIFENNKSGKDAYLTSYSV